MDYAEMKVAAKKLGIKSVGVKKEKMLDSILDKIEEMMDVEGWVEAHQDLMTIYNAETETEAGEEEEGVETSEGVEVNEDELAEAEEKAKVAKEKADKKKVEKKEKKDVDSSKSKWNHRIAKQAGFIDKYLLEGTTLETLIAEMKKTFGFESDGAAKGRIRGHILHLVKKHGVTVNDEVDGEVTNLSIE